jgi:hypothetical protein
MGLVMLTEWTGKEKLVRHLTTFIKKVDKVDDQKRDGGIVYKQILINAKLQIGKRGQKTELTGKSPLRRRTSALDCSVI